MRLGLLHILEDRCYGHAGAAKGQAPPCLPGTGFNRCAR